MELPRLQKLWEQYRDKGFEVVALESQRDTEHARQLIDKEGLSFTLLENGEGEAEVVERVFMVTSFPTSFLIDRDGRVLYRHVGFEEGDERQLEKQLLGLLQTARVGTPETALASRIAASGGGGILVEVKIL